MPRRPHLVLLLVAAFALLALAGPVSGLHTEGVPAGFHDTATIQETEMTLYLHCEEGVDGTTGQPTGDCDDNQPNKKIVNGTSQSGALDDVLGGEVTYTFAERTEGQGYAFSRGFSDVDVDLVFLVEWRGDEISYEVTLEEFGDGTPRELGSHTFGPLPPTGSLQATTNDTTFTNLELEAGNNIRLTIDPINVGPAEELKVIVDDGDDPSRLEFEGDLVATRAWTHATSGSPKSTFSLEAPASARRVLGTYVVTSAFGQDGLDLSSAEVSGEFDGRSIDLKPNATGDTIGLSRVGSSTQSHQILRFDEAWEYASDREAGIYTLDLSVDSNLADTIDEEPEVILGAGIDVTTVGPATREVHVGENATYTAVVTNGATEDLEVELDISVPTGDWVGFAESPRVVVAEGESRRVTVQVRPPASAPPGSSGTTTIGVEAVTRPDIEPTSTEVVTEVTDVVRYEPVVEALGNGSKTIAPGTTQTFDLDVLNNGTVRDTFFFRRDRAPDGWTTSFSTSEVTLDPGERQEINVTVRADDDEANGTSHIVRVVAQSQGDAQVLGPLDLDLTVGVLADFDVAFLQRVKTIRSSPPSDTGVAWRATITSHGNVELTIDASVQNAAGNDVTGQAITTRDSVKLSPGQMGEIEVAFKNFCGTFDPPKPLTLTLTPKERPEAARSFELVAHCNLANGQPRLLMEARTDPELVGGLERDERGRVELRQRFSAEPGFTLALPARVTNLGTEKVGLTLSIAQAPPEWNVTIQGWSGKQTVRPTDATRTDEFTAQRCGLFCRSATIAVEVPENATAGKHTLVAGASNPAGGVSAALTYIVEVGADRRVSVDVVESDLRVPPGGDALYNIVVTNEGNLGEEVNLTYRTITLPEDWTMRPGPDTLNVPPLTSRYITTVLTPPEDADPGVTGLLNVTASTAFGTSDTVALRADVVEEATIDLTSDFPSGSVEPGSSIPYNVTVTNRGDVSSRIDLRTAPVPEGFETEILRNGNETPDVRLGPDASTSVTVRLHVPDGAAGLVGTVLSASYPGSESEAAIALNATIERVEAVRLTAEPRAIVTPPGQGGEYALTITNRGTATDTFFLCVLPACLQTVSTQGWTSSLGRSVITVDAKASRSVLLDVVPSQSLGPGVPHMTLVKASSKSDPQVAAAVRVNTTTLLRDVGFAGNATVGAAPGETVTLNPLVVNQGNADDFFRIETVGAPSGWSARVLDDVQMGPGDRQAARVEVDVPGDATQGLYAIRVRARSQFDNSVEATSQVLVRISDFALRDVDVDGFDEAAVDRNLDPSDGREVFTEITADQGIRAEVIKSGRFGGTVRTGFILRTQQDPVAKHRFWSPDTETLTNVSAARILRPDALVFVVDANGDGRAEFAYDQREDRVLDAISVEGRSAVLVDAGGDAEMDVFHSFDRAITTRTGSFPGDEVAVDSDGDDDFDLLVDQSDGSSRPFTVMDATTRAAAGHGVLLLLGLVVVFLSAVAWLVRVRGEPA